MDGGLNHDNTDKSKECECKSLEVKSRATANQYLVFNTCATREML